jgi:hypothetical protein
MLKIKIAPMCFFALCLLTALSFACRQNTNEQKVVTNPPTNTTNAAPETKEYAVKVKIKTTDDKPVVEVKFDGSNTKLEYGGKVVRGELKDDKRKYFYEAGSQIAEVKAKDADGFKIRTTDGKLLWKVKISADKIKISDNEENQNAFELVKKDDGAKIEQNENKIGEVKFYKDRQKIKVKDSADKEVFDGNTDKYSVSYGVLLLDKIPEELRYIIIAELLARNL